MKPEIPKFTQVEQAFKEAIKKKKAEKGEATENPETPEQIQKDLGEMGITRKEKPEMTREKKTRKKSLAGPEIREGPKEPLKTSAEIAIEKIAKKEELEKKRIQEAIKKIEEKIKERERLKEEGKKVIKEIEEKIKERELLKEKGKEIMKEIEEKILERLKKEKVEKAEEKIEIPEETPEEKLKRLEEKYKELFEKPPEEIKPGLKTPEERQEEIKRIWAEKEEKWEEELKKVPEILLEEKKPEVEKEKTREELEKELEKRRKDFSEAYKQSREVLAKGKKEKKLKELLEAYEPTIEKPREKYILAGDSEKLKQGDKEAEERREKFITELTNRGIKEERARAIYEGELRKAEYEETKVELGKKLAEQGVEKEEISKKLLFDERELLNQAKVETWPPKEKNIFRRGMEWWMRKGTTTRLLISTGLVTGVVASVGGFGAPAVAIYASYRFIRGFGSVMIAKLAGKGVDIAMTRGIEAKKEAAMEKLKTSFDLEKLKETSEELEKILEETAKRERRKLLIKGITMTTVGAGTAIGMGMLEQVWARPIIAPEIPPKAPPAEIEIPPKPGVIPAEIKPEITPEAVAEIKPEILPIGERGPEGAIIDYFRENPEMAVEKFGCPSDLVKEGTIEDLDKFNEWAGTKAHQLWLEDAKEALAKPETLEQLKKLGYSPDAEGYEEMMRRIGKGFVELDPETGKINLVDMEYLKARALTPEEIALAEERISKPVVEMPEAKPTEQIFAEAGPEITRTILTEKLHETFGIWSGTYDNFSDINLKKFLELDILDESRVTGPPWEGYDYSEISSFQKKLEAVYKSLDSIEKSSADKLSVDNFIKKYYLKIFP